MPYALGLPGFRVDLVGIVSEPVGHRVEVDVVDIGISVQRGIVRAELAENQHDVTVEVTGGVWLEENLRGGRADIAVGTGVYRFGTILRREVLVCRPEPGTELSPI